MLTHMNLAAGIAGFMVKLPEKDRLCSSDRHLSYLPASHMFERIISIAMLYYGASIGFFSGNIIKLFDDVALLKPTVFPSVPRLLSRLYDKVVAGVSSSSAKKLMFDLAYARKKVLLENGRVTRSSIWDILVFSKIQARLGGCVRLVITGAAPIDIKVVEFLRIALGCQVLEGYGQTETSATGCLTLYGDYGLDLAKFRLPLWFPCWLALRFIGNQAH